MGKPSAIQIQSRDWVQKYAIYGSDDWHTVYFLLFHSLLFFLISFLILIYFFNPILHYRYLSEPTSPFLRFSLALIASFSALSSICLLFAASNVLYSSLPLRFEIAQRIISSIPDWSAVRTALDVGCNRGILLNAIAMQMKKQGSSGRVVGLDTRRETAVEALRRASAEGVQEYVTCREGDARRMPFGDGYFDVVVSAVHLSGLGKAAEERGRGLGEMVRVLKPGGIGVVWDYAVSVREYVNRLQEMRMEDIRVSERVTAYMASSHILSFRKPEAEVEVVVDWRANIC